MRILALDTSTLTGSIALIDAPNTGEDASEKILAEETLRIESTHSEKLMPSLERLLREFGLSARDLNGIAIALGPGSFTGLRIGVATVKGLAYAAGIPAVGVPTLDALAQNVLFAPGQVCVLLDARKKEVYASLFRGNGSALKKITPDWVLPPEELCSRITEETLFIGNGCEVYGGVIRGRLGPLARFAPPAFSLPRAAHVARLSIPKFHNGEVLDLFSFIPIYIRRSEAEINLESKAAALSRG
jgi:tRNA threonylcarbamoyladenosine biosynthesis protein TsaB